MRWNLTVEERFWAKVNKDGPLIRPELGSCWVWTAANKGDGRGVFRFNGRLRPAPVVSYILTTGHEPPPEAPYITHLCDGGNIGCVRPSHLMPDTNLGNVAQMIERGRMPRGEGRAHVALTADKVREIRRRYSAGGVTHDALAAECGVSRRAIGQAITGKKWKHV
jgi:hypothetical protein